MSAALKVRIHVFTAALRRSSTSPFTLLIICVYGAAIRSHDPGRHVSHQSAAMGLFWLHREPWAAVVNQDIQLPEPVNADGNRARDEQWRSIKTRKGSFVDRWDSESASDSSSTFLSQALGPIFLALPLAYPDGPGSVPDHLETRTVRINHRNTATVITSRESNGEIRFDIRIVGDAIPQIKGVYRAGLLPALPGDFDLRGWYHAPFPRVPGQPPRTPEPAPERLELLRLSACPRLGIP